MLTWPVSLFVTTRSSRPLPVVSTTSTSGIDRDGGLEGAGLPGDALAVEDVTRPVDDQHILGAVAVDVGDQGRGMRRRGELSGSGERAVAVAQQHRDVAQVVYDVVLVRDGQVGSAVAGEVTRHDRVGPSSNREPFEEQPVPACFPAEQSAGCPVLP